MLRNYEADQASSPAESLTGGRGLLSASAPSMFPGGAGAEIVTAVL